MNRKEFLKKFKEYVESVLDSKNYDESMRENKVEPTKEQMTSNIENWGCPFHFRWIKDYSALYIGRRDNGEWSIKIDTGVHTEYGRYSQYYHKWKYSHRFKKQLVKIIKEVE